MAKKDKPPRPTFAENFKQFFFRGLAIVLPTVLTIWLLIAGYNFLDDTIAEPINQGVRIVVVRFSNYPQVDDQEKAAYLQAMDGWARKELMARGEPDRELEYLARKDKLRRIWRNSPYFLDLLGVVLAVIIIYLVGGFLGSFIGRRLYWRGEQLVAKLPLIRNVYSSFKQLTEFFFGDPQNKLRFNRVVLLEYPRKGIWSIGLVTGESMPVVDGLAGEPCATIFMPSSPTPFTGYVLFLPKKDIHDLPLTIDEAMLIIISGGVVGPWNRGNRLAGDDRLARIQGVVAAAIPAADAGETAVKGKDSP
jgi:uncharacterized membrane protein